MECWFFTTCWSSVHLIWTFALSFPWQLEILGASVFLCFQLLVTFEDFDLPDEPNTSIPDDSVALEQSVSHLPHINRLSYDQQIFWEEQHMFRKFLVIFIILKRQLTEIIFCAYNCIHAHLWGKSSCFFSLLCRQNLLRLQFGQTLVTVQLMMTMFQSQAWPSHLRLKIFFTLKK